MINTGSRRHAWLSSPHVRQLTVDTSGAAAVEQVSAAARLAGWLWLLFGLTAAGRGLRLAAGFWEVHLTPAMGLPSYLCWRVVRV
jgi:hypothetical protein